LRIHRLQSGQRVTVSSLLRTAAEELAASYLGLVVAGNDDEERSPAYPRELAHDQGR
jgi:hypothetical protein